jgi:hypothetical protein
VRIANITFPKAGSQWLRDLLTDARVLPTGIQDVGTLGIRQVSTFAQLPDRSLVAPFYSVRRELWERYAGHDDRAVVLIRDPRDMLVSWLFSALYSHGSDEPHVSVSAADPGAAGLAGAALGGYPSCSRRPD